MNRSRSAVAAILTFAVIIAVASSANAQTTDEIFESRFVVAIASGAAAADAQLAIVNAVAAAPEFGDDPANDVQTLLAIANSQDTRLWNLWDTIIEGYVFYSDFSVRFSIIDGSGLGGLAGHPSHTEVTRELPVMAKALGESINYASFASGHLQTAQSHIAYASVCFRGEAHPDGVPMIDLGYFHINQAMDELKLALHELELLKAMLQIADSTAFIVKNHLEILEPLTAI